jgi:hypothetical protein
MDPLHATIALAPAAVYLLLIGMLNLSSRPFVTSGIRDSAALGIAVSGFVIAGPMELFLPEKLIARFAALEVAWVIWPILILFYVLCLMLLVLLQRPRIVVYNVTPDQLRAALADVITQLDKEARIAGDSICLPNLGVQLHVEPLPLLKNVQLTSSGPAQSYQGWRDLEIAVRAALRESRGTANPYGITLVFFGLAMLAIITSMMAWQSDQIAQAWLEMMRTTHD